MTLVAVLLAVVAASLFALSVQLQYGVVAAESATERLGHHTLGRRGMARVMAPRRWLAGTSLVVVATVLHVGAMALAPLAIVQPICVLSLVLSVVFGAWSGRVSPTPWAVSAVMAVCVGVAGFVVLVRRRCPR